jgi:hypothetical protein
MLSIRRSPSADRVPHYELFFPSIRSRSSQGKSLSSVLWISVMAEMIYDWRPPTDSASVSRNGTCDNLRGPSHVSCLRVIWRFVQSTWKGESDCLMFGLMVGSCFKVIAPQASLAEKGTLSERDADLEKRTPTNDTVKLFCYEDMLKRPIRAEETGRLTGQAPISLSQRSDARNVRRVGSRASPPTSLHLSHSSAAKLSPRPLGASTTQRLLYQTHSLYLLR